MSDQLKKLFVLLTELIKPNFHGYIEINIRGGKIVNVVEKKSHKLD